MSHRTVLATALPLLISIGLAFIAFGFLYAVLPIKARLAGFSDSTIGLFGAFYYLGFIIGCLICPIIIQRIGHARAYAIFLALCVATPLLFFMIMNPYAWTALRFMTGICVAGARNVIESWLNNLSSMRTRKTTITTYVMVICIMNTLGQNLINMGHVHSSETFAIVAICFALSIIPVIASQTRIPPPPQHIHLRPGWLFQMAALPAIACLCVGLLNGPYVAYTSLYLFDKGFSSSASILFMSCLILGGSLAQLPAGWMTGKIGYRNAILLLSALGAGMAALISFKELSYLQLLISAVIFGSSLWPAYSLSVTKANDCIEPEDMVSMSSVLLLLYAAGSVTGSFMMSWIAGIWGVKHLFVYYAAIHALLLFIFLITRCKTADSSPIPGGPTTINPRLPEFSPIY